MLEVDVYYEDTDCGGVVYYANYLKYFERGRTRFLEESGHSLLQWMQEGYLFTVVHAEIFYRSPARYRDRLEVATRLVRVTRSELSFSYRITGKTSNALIAEGTTRLVPVGPNGKIRRLPVEKVEVLNRLASPAG